MVQKKSKFSNYPTLNARSDVYFVLQKHINRTSCDKLKAIISTIYQTRDNQGYIVATNLKIRDEMVREIAKGLKGTSIFLLTLDDWLIINDLVTCYLELLDMRKMTLKYWEKVYCLLHEQAFYKTFDEAKRAGGEQLLQWFNIDF